MACAAVFAIAAHLPNERGKFGQSFAIEMTSVFYTMKIRSLYRNGANPVTWDARERELSMFDWRR
jgi:hypothetical protein